jgi:rfaE bifunctional protein nucleotidyltransferase chain/domain
LAEPGRAVQHVEADTVIGDPCGAGDRLAAATAVARARGTDRFGALRTGVASARDWVAGQTSTQRWLPRSRPPGGTLVAAGGCFDLLHAGHVRLLQAARAMGDELVVCLNSDRSVRRLKGPGRPVNPEQDRVAVLLGLGCVNRVEVFDEDTPCALLERLRPALFVKGGDYDGAVLPEREVLARWGGRLVFVDQVEGRSTTRLLARALELASA